MPQDTIPGIPVVDEIERIGHAHGRVEQQPVPVLHRMQQVDLRVERHELDATHHIQTPQRAKQRLGVSAENEPHLTLPAAHLHDLHDGERAVRST